MERQAFEQTGLIPRSIIRTLDRFYRQLLPGAERLVIQEFRISRYQVLVSVKTFLVLIIIPILVNILTKTFLIMPFIEYFWNTQQGDIFLNRYQESRALIEMQNFEEKLYFESFISDQIQFNHSACFSEKNHHEDCSHFLKNDQSIMATLPNYKKSAFLYSNLNFPFFSPSQKESLQNLNVVSTNLETVFQQKTFQLAKDYNQQSIQAITDFFGDCITFGTISFLFYWMKPQIIILKSFLTESLYSLNDTKKSFLLILVTDLLVGFHSPHGWEIFVENSLRHFGLPESEEFILLFVATFPVLLDTLFKYWIFRYLNQISPSTVATYHSMIE